MKKLFVLSFTFIALQVTAQDKTKEPLRSINVSGSAEMEVTPDEIYVQIDLREYDKKGSGKIDIESIRNNFLNAVKSIGLTENDISVQGYSGYGNNYWWYKKKNSKNPDMKASISYVIKLSSTSKMDELVAKLDDEATQNFFIQRVAHSKIQEYRKQLKIQAVKSAKEKAIYLAEAIGEKVGDAITINEPHENNYWYQNQPRGYANSNATITEVNIDGVSASTPMNVDFKKIKLKFDVQANFALSK